MGQDSAIEWTHHTFNPWRGCTKISPGCANCYAEKLSHRNPAVLGEWGDGGTRVIAAESYWRQPLAWDRAAKAAGERHRVFCSSLADVFEDRPELVAPRVRLFHLINETKNLDWLLLTKRPENILQFRGANGGARSWPENFPSNVWLGVSVEDQKRADERISALMKIPADVRFLSCEPLLGPVRLFGLEIPTIHWVIAGGESGPSARPMNYHWIEDLRDQCLAARVPFFFKQWGEWSPYGKPGDREVAVALDGRQIDITSDSIQAADRERRVEHMVAMYHVGKKAAGRIIAGRTWDQLPGGRR